MDLKAFMSGKKPLKKIIIPPPSSRKHVPKDMSELKKELAKPPHERSINNRGYTYVAAYQKEEERQMFEAERTLENPDSFDNVSIGTASTMADFNGVDDTQIYRTYDFTYRPKQRLTINTYQEKIVDMIETNPVVIIQGPTGCGKTTQVPQFIIDHSFRKKEHCNIIVTQPRRIAAISIAKRVSQERNWPLGTLVGYKVGMSNNTSQDTRLTYCTTGVLLRKLINAKHMLDFTHVILDEVHERDQEMDFVLLVVRKFLRTNSRSVKVILMSATINPEKFGRYFSFPVANQKLVPAPIIDLGKRSSYEVNKFFLCQLDSIGKIPEISFDEPKITSKMMEFSAKLLIVFDDIDKKDHVNSGSTETYDRHVVLMFLPGIWEIEEMYNIMMAKKYESTKWDIIILHSMITNEEQQKIFEPPQVGYRRVILSTNIAESSITVPRVKYVIDFCLTKVLVNDSATNFKCLELSWASKANCEQRAGRTGRVMDGRVYRLVPISIYEDEFAAEGSPEMLRAPLEQLVLNAKLLDMGEPKAILALSLDPPDLANLETTILLLKEIGALLNRIDDNPFDGELTSLGRLMANLPVDIHIARLIALGHTFGVLRSTIIIGASMATKSMFNNPFNMKIEAYNAKLRWSEGSWSDCTTYLQAYQVWQMEKANLTINSKQSEKNWAYRHFIQLKILYEIHSMVSDLTLRLQNYGIVVPMGHDKDCMNSDPDHALILKVVIAGAFYPNYFISRGEHEDDGLSRVKILGGHDPLTTIYYHGWSAKLNGTLYAQRFQEVLKKFGVSNSLHQIRVSFDNSSRVYVTFPQRDHSKLSKYASNDPKKEADIPGRVPTAVYKALKLRRLDMNMCIPVMSEHASEQRLEEMGLPSEQVNTLLLSQDTKSKAMLKKKNIRSLLPALDMSFIPIFITNIIDPGHFWVSIKDQDTMEMLTNIEANANNLSLSEAVQEKPKIGDVILSPYRMRGMLTYCRGLVESIYLERNEQHAQMLLIDFGFKTQARISDLRNFKNRKTFVNIPALAFECVLANIKPSILRNINGEWTHKAYQDFDDLLKNETKLYGEIYSVVNSVVALNLICDGEKKISVNEFMIEKGHALFRAEGYLSRQNHDVRQRHLEMSDLQRQFYEESQYDNAYLTQMYPKPPDLEDCTNIMTMRGPHSPLEVELVHVVVAGSTKKVKIDNVSVNAILLDPNPEEPEQLLVVAASVTQNVAGNTLSLRNTTLMPNIRGLTSLLALIFAPCVDLKRNDFRNRYAGVLCGLGYDPITKEPLFKEHDMQITFDVEITNDDLMDVNALRHWMCTAMQVPETHGDDVSEIEMCQTKCREKLLKLLEKQRNPIKVGNVPYHASWDSCEQSAIMRPKYIDIISNNIYPLHCAKFLENISKDYEDMVMHIQHLKEIVNEDPKKRNGNIACDLCETEVFGLYQLRTHLYSEEHKENEKNLYQKHGVRFF